MHKGDVSELGFLALYSCPEQYGSSYVASVVTGTRTNNAAPAVGDTGVLVHVARAVVANYFATPVATFG